MSKIINIIKKLRKRKAVSQEESPLLQDIKSCAKYCLTEKPYTEEKAKLHMERGLIKVSSTINKLNIEIKLSEWEGVLLFWSCLTLFVNFFREFRRTERLSQELDMRKSRGQITSFLTYYQAVNPGEEDKIMDWFLKFWTTSELWNESITMYEVCRDFLKTGISYDVITISLLRRVPRIYVTQDEEIMNNVGTSMELLFLNLSCKSYTYVTKKCFKLLLNIYHSLYASRFTNKMDSKFCSSVLKSLESFTIKIDDYKGLCYNVETTAGFILEKALTPTEVIELGQVMCTATSRYQNVTFTISLTDTVSNCILNMINSTDKEICFTGYGIFIYILDRHQNKYVFKKIQLYKKNFLYQRYDLNMTSASREELLVDGKVFRNLNHALNRVISESILRFKTDLNVLKRAYVCICLMVVEVKVHTVAINVIHIAIKLQEAILIEQTKPKANYELCAAFHSYIISIMSFVCYVHDEDCESLTTYIEGVINARRQKADYLLPFGVPGKLERKIEEPLILEKEVYLDLAEIHLAIQQSWNKYSFQPDFVLTDLKNPPTSHNFDEIHKLKDDGITTYDTLLVDEYDAYLKTVPLQFGITDTLLSIRVHPKGPVFRPGHSFLMKSLPSISEYYDRFHFFIELRTPLPTQPLILEDAVFEEKKPKQAYDLKMTRRFST